MAKRIAAIILIYLGTTAAWMVLGGTIVSRSDSSRVGLGERVASNWGTEQIQAPPTAKYVDVVTESVVGSDGKPRPVNKNVDVSVPLQSSDVHVSFNLDYRQKGLLWYSTYKVGYTASYVFHNPSQKDQLVLFRFRLPARQAIYDGMLMKVDGVTLPMENDDGALVIKAGVPAGRTATLEVAYRSQGLSKWAYAFDSNVAQVHNFRLVMATDFADINFPENSLSPTEKKQTAQGWELTWKFESLLTGFNIAMEMPEKLQPGVIAGEICFFAPVPLFFFFFLMFIITTLRNLELHPMNYLFLAGAFFAFHLLLAYTADHIDIHLAFVISSAVSVFLVISYLRLVVGMRFAAVEAGISQLVYLVLFSYAFFFKGFTGLSITIGSIVTLFVVMQMTGRIRWAEKFQSQKPAASKAP
jgi:hypothetical protein